jgi:ammonium transporter, Amt family
VLVVVAVLAFDRVRVDDPVGALSVHLVNGLWGTLCVGLFASADFSNGSALLANGRGALIASQLTGMVAVAMFTLVGSTLAWFAIKALMGIRVTEEEETEGLDVGEHGNAAYPDFGTVGVFGHGSHGETAHAATARVALTAPVRGGN